MFYGAGKSPDKAITGYEMIDLCEKLGSLFCF